MLDHKHIPLDPGEIDHVLMLLRGELDPEYIRACKTAGIGRLDLHRRVRTEIEAIIQERLKDSWKCPRDNSDWAHLASDDSVSGFDRACARARCSLWWLEECANSQADRTPDPDDLPVDAWDQDWERLRLALVEVAHWLTFSELLDSAKRAKQAAAHAEAIRADVTQLDVFRKGRQKGSILPQTRYLVDLIEAHPELTTKGIAKLVRRDAESIASKCPFDVEGDQDVMRQTGKVVNLEVMIENARKRHVNRSDTAN